MQGLTSIWIGYRATEIGLWLIPGLPEFSKEERLLQPQTTSSHKINVVAHAYTAMVGACPDLLHTTYKVESIFWFLQQARNQ